MSDENLLLVEELPEIGTTVLRMNRPKNRNAFNPEAWAELRDTVARVAVGPKPPVIMLASAVRGVFSSGFEMADTQEIGPGTPLDEGLKVMDSACDQLGTIGALTVAFADGAAFGGGNELFASCDIRLATLRAQFRIPVARLSSMYPLPGLRRLAHRMHRAPLTEMLLTGVTLSAEEALHAGLVTRLVPDEEQALQYCERAARAAPLAVSSNKQGLNAAIEHLYGEGLTDAERAAIEAIRKTVFESADRKEALAAFVEKREPRFQGV